MIAHAALTGLRARWGIAPCPPTPVHGRPAHGVRAREEWPGAGDELARPARWGSCACPTPSLDRELARRVRRGSSPSAPPAPSSAGWKMKWTVPSKPLVLREMAGRAEEHRGVAVVPAAVHLARDAATTCSNVLSSSIARASMSARRPDRPIPAPALEGPDHSGAARGRARIGMPHCTQALGDHVRGPVLLVGELGVAMEIPADLGHLVVVGDDVVNQVHESASWGKDGRAGGDADDRRPRRSLQRASPRAAALSRPVGSRMK